MIKRKASQYIKIGTCLRYLIDVKEGSAIGKARPDEGQSENDFLNAKMEKINQNKNVLSNMQKVDSLLRDIGFKQVRKTSQEHLRNDLIPAATLIMKADDGKGILTEELAGQISKAAREIRKGLVEAADQVELFDQVEVNKWPDKFKSELIWPIPWWLILAFVAAFGLGISFAETPIYEKGKEFFISTEAAPTTKSLEQQKAENVKR